ncbi:MAG TPA: DUF302 domain-containing protein [Mycobacteriales bacterium]|nr:DUF302 domain-containing protein [Mycobacteriales bacterium]
MTEGGEIVSVASPYSVEESVERLVQTINLRNLTVFAVIDHSGGAHAVGLDMPDTKVVIFGNPRSGTPVMLAAPLSALDLPLKALVRADPDGSTQVSYLKPAALAARYGVNTELVAPLEGIKAIVTEAVK